jgi:putative oxygen-independent coproporphyrinogen III oxidase
VNASSAAVYVHVPWCLQRCPYCDFATEAISPARIPHEAYARAVVRELELREAAMGAPLAPISLFFGGGTPSLWHRDALAAVVRAVTDRGPVSEVTVECNPTSIDRDRASALRDRGVTRLSLGVQSLRDKHLRYLGRLHDADGALRAVREAVAAGGLRVSADVMFGMDAQRRDELVEDLDALVGAGVEHVSAYALTIESGTRFGELARKGRLPRLQDDDVADLYEAVETTLAGHGLAHYEVSNYAREGCGSEHNLSYWRGAAYLGLGAGAVGCLPLRDGSFGAERWRNLHDVPAYLAALEAGHLPPGETETLDADTRVREGLLLGMRTREGTNLAAWRARVGVDPRAGREARIQRQVERGNVVDDGVTLRIPSSRWLLADDIVSSVF